MRSKRFARRRIPQARQGPLAALEGCPLTKLRRYRDGEKLFEAGDRDFKFYVVKSGEVEIVDDSGRRRRRPSRSSGPGEFTGEWRS